MFYFLSHFQCILLGTSLVLCRMRAITNLVLFINESDFGWKFLFKLLTFKKRFLYFSVWKIYGILVSFDQSNCVLVNYNKPFNLLRKVVKKSLAHNARGFDSQCAILKQFSWILDLKHLLTEFNKMVYFRINRDTNLYLYFQHV